MRKAAESWSRAAAPPASVAVLKPTTRAWPSRSWGTGESPALSKPGASWADELSSPRRAFAPPVPITSPVSDTWALRGQAQAKAELSQGRPVSPGLVGARTALASFHRSFFPARLLPKQLSPNCICRDVVDVL